MANTCYVYANQCHLDRLLEQAMPYEQTHPSLMGILKYWICSISHEYGTPHRGEGGSDYVVWTDDGDLLEFQIDGQTIELGSSTPGFRVTGLF